MSDHDLTELPAPVILSFGRHAPDEPPPLEPAPNLETVETETRHYRHDGWTPAARAAFLEILAKSGVLNRLDARTDRAERFGEPTLRLAANWEAWLAAMAEDRTADMQAMLAPLPLEGDDDGAIFGQGSDSMLIHQLHQLQQGKALDEQADFADEDDDARVWIQDHSWRTNFPPPADFNGNEEGYYGDDDYNRNCTPEERELLDRRYPDAFTDAAAEQRQADEAERDAFFAALAEPESSLSRSDGEVAGQSPDGGARNV